MAAPPSKRLINLDEIPGAPSWLEKVVSPLNAFIKATVGALDSGITFAQQFPGEVKTIQLTPPDDWVPLALKNGWVQLNNSSFLVPAYRQSYDTEVTVRGILSAPTSPAPSAGQAIANNIPKGGGQERYILEAANSPWYAGTQTNGTLTYNGGSGSFYSLYGIKYMPADRTPPRWANPIDVKLGAPQKPFPGRPGQVLVLACRQAQSLTASAIVLAVDWTAQVLDKKTPAIRIHRVWGLAPGVAYSLTLLVLPE